MIGFMPTPDGYESFLVRVNPRSVEIPDLVEADEPDESLWLVEVFAGDELLIPMDDLRKNIASLIDPDLVSRHGPEAADLLTRVHLTLMLWHPRSPYGYGIRHVDPPEIIGGSPQDMLVIFRGKHYNRDEAGVLTPTGERDPDWPTPEHWRRTQIATRMVARKQGLL